MEKRMRKIIFLFTLVTTIPIIPVTVVWYVTGHCVRCQRYQPLVLTEKVLNQLVFVKFVLDPFVWRMAIGKIPQSVEENVMLHSMI